MEIKYLMLIYSRTVMRLAFGKFYYSLSYPTVLKNVEIFAICKGKAMV